MNWKNKARIQSLVAVLPSKISYHLYYFLQRKFGNLKVIKVERKFIAAINTVKKIKNTGNKVDGKVYFEIGTGRMPLVPIAYFLMGAKEVITIDLNPYLKTELLEEAMQYVLKHQTEIEQLFGGLLVKDRFDGLIRGFQNNMNANDVISFCKITYIAPGDAASTNLPDNSIDFHTSYTVFEHIPKEVIVDIMREAKRITKPSGFFIHRIDYSDHFSHRDKTISAINFLQYDNKTWDKFAGNRYMYRLREDDFIEIFSNAGLDILDMQSDISSELEEMIDSGFKVHEQFNDKPIKILATTGTWFIMTNPNS